MHSSILVPSLWRVFPITLFSQTDMPSLTTVTLRKSIVFRKKKTLHTRSSSSSSPSFLDITPALKKYIPSSSRCSILSPPSSHTHVTQQTHHFFNREGYSTTNNPLLLAIG